METLIFATNNTHKIEEIRLVLGNRFKIETLIESGINIEIPEPYVTLEANASQKSSVIHKLTLKNCFSEDTGLEVETLNGEPGVKSARYAGEGRSFENNIEKLLENLKLQTNRNARFRTVISLIINNKETLFEGICTGIISMNKKGSNGFGYDSVFIPNGSLKTFAEMTMEEKSVFSHRKKALEKLVDFLSPRSK